MSMSNPSSCTDFGRQRARSKTQMLKDNVSTIIKVLFSQFIKYPVLVATSAILASGFKVGRSGGGWIRACLSTSIIGSSACTSIASQKCGPAWCATRYISPWGCGMIATEHAGIIFEFIFSHAGILGASWDLGWDSSLLKRRAICSPLMSGEG